MDLLWILVIVFVLLMLFGNPVVGPRVYPAYNYGWRPGIVGVIVVILLLFFLFGSGSGHSLRFR